MNQRTLTDEWVEDFKFDLKNSNSYQMKPKFPCCLKEILYKHFFLSQQIQKEMLCFIYQNLHLWD
jgi:hypothetical protein